MRKRFRKTTVAVVTAAMILSLATPAAAFDRETTDLSNSVPMMFDILLMRPIGLAMTVAGVVFYFPVALMTLVTRPSDIAKPLGPLVVTPGRFTFVDPIGHHP